MAKIKAEEKEIENKLRKLPENLKKEVLDYIEFLIKKYRRELNKKEKGKENKVKGFKFDWEGGLADLKGKFTSVQLQHKASDWR
jgi:hypothetical protein